MKKINEMLNNDLVNLIKIKRILTGKIKQHNNNKNNFGFEISLNFLIDKQSYYFLKYIKAVYNDFGFIYINKIIELSKNNSYEVFLEKLKLINNLVKNLKTELIQLIKISDHYYHYCKNLKYINDSSVFNYEITNNEKGITLTRKDYLIENKLTNNNYFKEEKVIKEVIITKQYTNFLELCVKFAEDLEDLLIFREVDV